MNLDALLDFVPRLYRFGFTGFGPYCQVGAVVGLCTAALSLANMTRQDWRRGPLRIIGYALGRFLAGMVFWPMTLFLLPLIGLLLAALLGVGAVVGFVFLLLGIASGCRSLAKYCKQK